MAKSRSLRTAYGPIALVTGAASGIGAAFADRLAREGFSLVLVDLDGDRLDAHVTELRARHHVDVRPMRLDLSDSDEVARLAHVADTDEVGLVVHAAGIHLLGPMVDLPYELQLRSIDLHCRTSFTLAYRFGKAMRARKRGGLILLSSNSAILSSPLIANYAATKAYTLALASALWEEMRHDGVDVLGLVPGMTDTPALNSQHPTARAKAFTQHPDAVVEGAFANLGSGPIHITSFGDRIAAGIFGRLLPRSWSLPLARRSLVYFFPHLRGR